MRVAAPGQPGAQNADDKVRSLLAGSFIPLPVAAALMCSVVIALAARDLRDFDYLYYGGLALRVGESPYIVPGFYSPLHILIYFSPLSLLPLDLAFRINALVCLSAFTFAFWRISKGETQTFILLMLSPFPIFTAYFGNVEWLIVLAVVVDPAIGVLLALVKPQIGFVLAAVLWLEVWRANKPRAAILAIGVVSVYAVSVFTGMRWGVLSGQVWNISPWPYLVPAGAFLCVRALVKRSRLSALAAAPLLSPYLGTPASWVGLLPLLSARRRTLILAVIASWLLVFYWCSR